MVSFGFVPLSLNNGFRSELKQLETQKSKNNKGPDWYHSTGQKPAIASVLYIVTIFTFKENPRQKSRNPWNHFNISNIR